MYGEFGKTEKTVVTNFKVQVLYSQWSGRNEENHDNLSQDDHCSSQDSNQVYPKYKSDILT